MQMEKKGTKNLVRGNTTLGLANENRFLGPG